MENTPPFSKWRGVFGEKRKCEAVLGAVFIIR